MNNGLTWLQFSFVTKFSKKAVNSFKFTHYLVLKGNIVFELDQTWGHQYFFNKIISPQKNLALLFQLSTVVIILACLCEVLEKYKIFLIFADIPGQY